MTETLSLEAYGRRMRAVEGIDVRDGGAAIGGLESGGCGLRVYLDVSCLNRPFDDQSQLRIAWKPRP